MSNNLELRVGLDKIPHRLDYLTLHSRSVLNLLPEANREERMHRHSLRGKFTIQYSWLMLLQPDCSDTQPVLLLNKAIEGSVGFWVLGL
jgi:hypothetical protein